MANAFLDVAANLGSQTCPQSSMRIMGTVMKAAMAGPGISPAEFYSAAKPILSMKGSFWLKEMKLEETNFWAWQDDPSGENVKLVQTLRMRPSHPLNDLKAKLEKGIALTPLEIFGALKQGLNREVIENYAAHYGEGITQGELDQWEPVRANAGMGMFDFRAGFALEEQEFTTVFDQLAVSAGTRILEIGPGHTTFCLIAAMMGAKVTAVEASRRYGLRLRAMAAQVKDLIAQAGGELRILSGQVQDEKIERELEDTVFDQIWMLDVLASPHALKSRASGDKNHVQQGVLNEEALRASGYKVEILSRLPTAVPAHKIYGIKVPPGGFKVATLYRVEEMPMESSL